MRFSSWQIKQLLGKPSYKPVDRMDKHTLTWEQKQEVNAIEAITSFGQDIIDLFNTLINQLGTLPTQAQFVGAGVELMTEWLEANRPDIAITDIVKEACKLRLTRTYMSKVIEIHLEAVIKEELPYMTVKTYPMVDSVMGVDLVLEDDKKRYYVHVTSNTPFAQKMLRQKEDRGGYFVGSSFVRYSRDFSGDLILKYDIHEQSDTTMLVNGFPLFKPEFISERFFIARRQSKIGEPIDAPYSKLQHFKDWAKTYIKQEI